MKINSHAWHAYRARLCAGLALLLVLALGVFGRVFRFDRDFSRERNNVGFAPGVRELADCLAAR